VTYWFKDACHCCSCLRSSPCASLFGLVIGLFGIGAFCGGCIFGRRLSAQLLHIDAIFPFYADYISYGVLASTVVFLFVVYIINAFSTGWNSKHFFDSSCRVTCGRCLNMSVIVLLAVALILWCCVLLVTALPIFVHLMLIIRTNQMNPGGSAASNYSFDLSYYGLFSSSGSGGGLVLDASNEDYIGILQNPLKATMTSLICYSVSLFGCLLMIISLLQLVICSAMNYARFEGIRYFESGAIDGHHDEACY